MTFTITTIAAFVGILNEATKAIARSFGKNVNRYIPICSIVYGIILGVCGYFLPDVQMGNNVVEAIAIGISAGLSSTGVHQAFHQLAKPAEDADPKADDEQIEAILAEDDDYDDSDCLPEVEFDGDEADGADFEVVPIPDEEEELTPAIQIPEDDE